MLELKQSTAVNVKLGPFVDDTDGKTAETGLTISQADIRLSKNGGSFAQTNNSAGATHDENGYYTVPLDTTDTGTLGTLVVAVSESGALPVFREFQIVTANYWDSKYSTDKLQVDVVQIAGDTQDATDLGDFAKTGYDPSTHKVEEVKVLTGHTVQTGDAYAIVNNGTYGNSAINAKLGSPAAASISADILNIDNFVDDVETTLATIITHMTDIKGTGFVKDTHSLPQCLTATGFSTHSANDVKTTIEAGGSSIAQILTAVGTTLPGLVGSPSVDLATDIAGVSDLIDTDTIAEMAQGVPPATPTPLQAIMYLYMNWRNKTTATATELAVYNDAGTKIAKSTIGDDSTTFTKNEFVSGA